MKKKLKKTKKKFHPSPLSSLSSLPEDCIILPKYHTEPTDGRDRKQQKATDVPFFTLICKKIYLFQTHIMQFLFLTMYYCPTQNSEIILALCAPARVSSCSLVPVCIHCDCLELWVFLSSSGFRNQLKLQDTETSHLVPFSHLDAFTVTSALTALSSIIDSRVK